MLTPQEVSEHAFAKAGFGGYNMAMVDEFLDQLTEDYTTLYKENAALKSKMKVLVDKVEEYRSTEDAMRKTLLTAQKMADDMVKEAEEKRASLVSHAEEEARKRVSGLRQEVEAEQLRLTAAQHHRAELFQPQIQLPDAVFPDPLRLDRAGKWQNLRNCPDRRRVIIRQIQETDFQHSLDRQTVF